MTGLQVFEKHPAADAYRIGGAFTPYAIVAKDKRFTDAELAAEVFSAIFHEAECEVRGRKIERQVPGHPAIDHYVTQNHEFGRQAGIIARFATLPHYDEETP